MNRVRYLFCLLAFSTAAYAQDSIIKPRKLSLSGYVKDLQSLNFDKDFRNAVSGNLLHNRLNFKWQPAVPLTAVAEFRTRLFWGEEMKVIPDFASQLRNKYEKLDMQKLWVSNESVILHSNIERLYVDWHERPVGVRVGRQRINWGIATSWNPNDIFNAYNFLDFDYEERAGVDAARVQYSINNSSTAEAAFAFLGTRDQAAAVKYTLNKWNYDFQFIGGWYKEHPTIGTGWAGNIADAGFKGEVQYYFSTVDSADRLNLAVEGDYMFKNGWYVNASLLVNNQGLTKPVTQWNLVDLNLSPENLMPAKWNFLLTTVKDVSPLVSLNMAAFYAPGTNILILLPSVSYNLATNFDVNLFGQYFFAELNNSLQGTSYRMYLRMRWSF